MPTLEIRVNEELIASLKAPAASGDSGGKSRQEHSSGIYEDIRASIATMAEGVGTGITVEVSRRSDAVVLHIHGQRAPAMAYRLSERDVLSICVVEDEGT